MDARALCNSIPGSIGFYETPVYYNCEVEAPGDRELLETFEKIAHALREASRIATETGKEYHIVIRGHTDIIEVVALPTGGYKVYITAASKWSRESGRPKPQEIREKLVIDKVPAEIRARIEYDMDANAYYGLAEAEATIPTYTQLIRTLPQLYEAAKELANKAYLELLEAGERY